jgi:hypothetical protein
MATIATPLPPTSTNQRSRALRSADALIAEYVHTLATAWAPEPAEPAKPLRRGDRSALRSDSAAPRTKTSCWNRRGRVANSFRSQHACEAC